MIRIYARKDQPKVAELMIFDIIGEDWFGDGITAKSVDQKLKEMGDVEQINVRINSMGGSVFDGLAIYNMLKSHKAKVNVVVEGIAASIASVIAMAGDSVSMGTGTKMMIHNPWTFTGGDSRDFRKTAETLDGIRDGMIEAYQSRTNLDSKEITAMLDEETWMGPDEAIEKGFADVKVTISKKDDDEEEDEEFSEKALAMLASFKHKGKFQPRIAAASRKQSAAADITEVNAMTPEEIAAAKAAEQARIEAEARTKALAEDKARREGIRALCTPFASNEAVSAVARACEEDSSCSIEAATAKILAEVAKSQTPSQKNSVDTVAGADARDKFLAGAEKAILSRMGREKTDPGNEFNGMQLHELAAFALNRAGISTRGMSKDAISRKVLASHTTSDFPLLTANVARKRLRASFMQVPRTWDQLVRIGSVPDFKQNDRLTLGSFSSLVHKPERGEYKQGTIGEESVGMKIATKGRYISFSRELLVNDDLNALDNMSSKMGQAAGRTVEIDFYALLNSNSGVGPTMADGGAFFNATAVTSAGGHANYVSSGTVISVTSLSAARAAMSRQMDKALQEYLGIVPAILLVAPEYEGLAYAVLNSLSDPSQSNPGKVNFARTFNLKVVSSPYVSGTNWFLFADPNISEAFEVAFLDGQQEPFIDEEIEFMTDAMNMKVRLDYGVAAIDWKPAYKNNGAAS